MASFKGNDPEIQDDFTETERQDKVMVERWRDEADSVLVFAGLFSAVGTVSLVESYKWLSPDSGDETVGLLAQLVNVTQKLPLTPGSSEPFRRTFDVVAVNVIWFASMSICIVCAIFATLIQQWARRYLALAQRCGAPDERARVRGFLFRGLRRFQMSRVCQLLGMGLHLSIGLYGLGILIFIFHVDRNLVVLAVFGFAPIFLIYTVLTYLPIFFLDSPYSTPFSAPAWRIWHFWLALIYSVIAILFSCVLSNVSVDSLRHRADNHRQQCAEGLKRSVEQYAKGGHA